MNPEIFENNSEGILCVYKNEKWLVCIKNWKPDNDIEGIAHLELHHSTDEQFILAAGKAILITAQREGHRFCEYFGPGLRQCVARSNPGFHSWWSRAQARHESFNSMTRIFSLLNA